MIIAQKYNTLEEYQAANNLAHETLKNEQGYNSAAYASEIGIKTVDGGYLLFELKQFSEQLKNAGFNFVEIDEKEIKVNEVI